MYIVHTVNIKKLFFYKTYILHKGPMCKTINVHLVPLKLMEIKEEGCHEVHASNVDLVTDAS
jgi:hypothetical protein